MNFSQTGNLAYINKPKYWFTRDHYNSPELRWEWTIQVQYIKLDVLFLHRLAYCSTTLWTAVLSHGNITLLNLKPSVRYMMDDIGWMNWDHIHKRKEVLAAEINQLKTEFYIECKIISIHLSLNISLEYLHHSDKQQGKINILYTEFHRHFM